MTLIELLSSIAGLTGATAIILTAVWVYRGFVQHKPVTKAQLLTTAILAIVGGSLRVVLDDVWPIAEALSYGYFSPIFVQFLAYHLLLVAAGILLLLSQKRPHLARAALGLQILSLLSIAVYYFGYILQTYMIDYAYAGTSDRLRYGFLPLLCAGGLAVYPLIVWFQSGKQR